MSTFKERYKKAMDDIKRIEHEKYIKYINQEYTKINYEYQLRDILTMKKGDMYVINDKKIFIYTGERYYWERHKVDHKRERLVKIDNFDYDHVRIAYNGYYEFRPSYKLCKSLKEKQKNGHELTEEENKAIGCREADKTFLIICGLVMIVIFLVELF